MFGKFKLFLVCSLVLSAVAVSSVQADMKDGWYLGAGLGYGMATDSDFTMLDVANDTGSFEYDSGVLVSAAAGYKFGMPRVEGEISYLKNDVDKITLNGATQNDSADSKTLAFMLNGYLDFANTTRFTPFINLGLGLAKADFNLMANGYSIDDSATVFAYQAGAGVGIDLSDNFVLDLKYCYFGTSDPEFKGSDGGKMEYESSSHRFIVGLRYSF